MPPGENEPTRKFENMFQPVINDFYANAVMLTEIDLRDEPENITKEDLGEVLGDAIHRLRVLTQQVEEERIGFNDMSNKSEVIKKMREVAKKLEELQKELDNNNRDILMLAKEFVQVCKELRDKAQTL